MKTIGFFNNKGGVGKTTLVYHVAWMMSLKGLRVIAADLDPQANLTSNFLADERLEEIWMARDRKTMYGAISRQFRSAGDLMIPHIEEISKNLGLIIGDLELSSLEDALSDAWARIQLGNERAFRDLSAFSRAINLASAVFNADVALIDVGPNLGPLNRAALLACDYVVVPLGADLFSLQGLRNMGPALHQWRTVWAQTKAKNPDPSLTLPSGKMEPLGYIVMRHSVLSGRPARAFSKWIARMPAQYNNFLLRDGVSREIVDTDADPHRLGRLKDYRSLIPMAQEARKPVFLLRPADGAFGGHQQAVQDCFSDFKRLSEQIWLMATVLD